MHRDAPRGRLARLSLLMTALATVASIALALFASPMAAAAPLTSNAPVVAVVPTPTGAGYWQIASDGGVFTFGDAQFYGSLGGARLNSGIVAVTRTPSGAGYWLTAADGGVFSFGDAQFFGSLGSVRLNAPIVGITATPTGNGYWLTASDGGVFSFGDAQFFGSLGGIRLNAPVVGIAATPTGKGYWLTGADGGMFSFGDAQFYGSLGGVTLAAPVVAIAPTPTGHGYWLTGKDGGMFAFGDAPFLGRVTYTPPAQPAPQPSTAPQLAGQLLTSRATFQTVHASGIADNANARQNIVDTANGSAAARSNYDADGAGGLPTAPGGVVALRPSMLQGLLTIAQSTTVRVSEVSGGQHHANSKHYAGAAFDIDLINGKTPNLTTGSNANATPLLNSCRSSGASLVQVENLGQPGTHVHCEWAG